MNVKKRLLEALKTQNPKEQLASLKHLVNDTAPYLPTRVDRLGRSQWPSYRCRNNRVEFEYFDELEQRWLLQFFNRIDKLPGIKTSVSPAVRSRTKKPCLLFTFGVSNSLKFGQFLRKNLSRFEWLRQQVDANFGGADGHVA